MCGGPPRAPRLYFSIPHGGKTPRRTCAFGTPTTAVSLALHTWWACSPGARSAPPTCLLVRLCAGCSPGLAMTCPDWRRNAGAVQRTRYSTVRLWMWDLPTDTVSGGSHVSQYSTPSRTDMESQIASKFLFASVTAHAMCCHCSSIGWRRPTSRVYVYLSSSATLHEPVIHALGHHCIMHFGHK